MSGLAKLTPGSRAKLRQLRDAPVEPGLPQLRHNDEPGRAFPIVMGVVKTPIIPGDTIGDSNHSESGQFVTARRGSTHPADNPDARQAITAVTGATLTVAGDYSTEAIAGTRMIIDGSTGNDGWHEVSIDPTYSVPNTETTFTFTRPLPDTTVDGVLVIKTGFEPVETEAARTAIASSSVVGFPGDHLLFAQIDGEMIPVAGPSCVYGYLIEDLLAAYVVSNVLKPQTARFQIYGFARDLLPWSDTGQERLVTNVWENVYVPANTMVKCERMGNRWMLAAVGCSVSDIDLGL